MPDTELIVLLDENYQPIGNAPKLASHHDHTPLHLAFSCYLFNQQGQLLVTRRAASKKVWPDILTNSFCGHPAPGESFKDAIERRGAFELGLTDIQNITEKLPDYRYTTPPYNGIIENEFCPVFFATTSSDPQPNPDEVSEWFWQDVSDLRAAIAAEPDKYSYWLKDQLAQLQIK